MRHFFLFILTLTKNASVLADKQLLFNDLKGVSSLLYIVIPSPEENRSKQIGSSEPGIKNWERGKV